MAPYETIYGRKCRSPIGWFEVGEIELIGPNLVHQAMEKGVLRFGKKGKLSPWYIGPYRISKRVDKVAYELELSLKLAAVHLVFHVSMLKKCLSDPSLIVPTENIGIKDSLSYEKVTIQILDRQVHKLRTEEVVSAKVLWRNQYSKEATWEAEEDMKMRHQHLFRSGEISNHAALRWLLVIE
ncbi:hypothetical protein MTR67_003215 [Solanum verrucosum]|uniref:Uncharacterized protein n=1 Tax=Solanum verrucosum TaxID=315347 RepID=A0AAF0PTW8_SOLVR|nr:hypothetical protein MTR67_003215 [Solanum verrucosum]